MYERILLIGIDYKYHNLALSKIEKYHLNKGNKVVWNDYFYKDLADRIYVSCIFEKNKFKCKEWEEDKRALIGGSGYSLKIVLPDEIEKLKPRINFGFTTRGCIRKCPWCIVPIKEGKIKAIGDLLDLWDGRSKDIDLADNNILALPEHFKLICQQARKNKIRIEFSQGLDHKLLNQDIINELKATSHKELHFAFDDIKDLSTVSKAIKLLRKNNINRSTWFVLVDFNTIFEQDLFRVRYLRNENQNVYLMRYNYKRGNKMLTALSRWTNNRNWFWGIDWEEFYKRNYLTAR